MTALQNVQEWEPWFKKMVGARDKFATEEGYQNEVSDMRDKADKVKQHLMDSNMVVQKDTQGIVVKIKN